MDEDRLTTRTTVVSWTTSQSTTTLRKRPCKFNKSYTTPRRKALSTRRTMGVKETTQDQKLSEAVQKYDTDPIFHRSRQEGNEMQKQSLLTASASRTRSPQTTQKYGRGRPTFRRAHSCPHLAMERQNKGDTSVENMRSKPTARQIGY